MEDEHALAEELWAHVHAQRPDRYEIDGMSGEDPVDIALSLGGLPEFGVTIPPFHLSWRESNAAMKTETTSMPARLCCNWQLFTRLSAGSTSNTYRSTSEIKSGCRNARVRSVTHLPQNGPISTLRLQPLSHQ